MLRRLHARAWRLYANWRAGTRRFAAFGKESAIAPPAVITSPHRIWIGDRVFFQRGSWIAMYEAKKGQMFEPTLRIGDRTYFGRDVMIACLGEVTIGEESLFADRVFIGDTTHGHRDPDTNIVRQPMLDPRPIRIGDGCFVGINAVILPGVTIGDRAMIGANSVVTKDVPANSMAAGVPARIVHYYDRDSGEWRGPDD